MQTLNEVAVAYVWNALWLSILLLLITEITVRLIKPARAVITHRIWVACFVLASTLPAIPLLTKAATTHPTLATTIVKQAGTPILPFITKDRAALPDTPTLTFDTQSPAHSRAVPTPPRNVKWMIVSLLALRILYIGSVVFALLKLTGGLWRTFLLRRRATPAVLSENLSHTWAACRAAFAVPTVALLSSGDVTSPATMTLGHPVIVIPTALLNAGPEMAAAFCHELAHVQRRDFLKNLAYELLAAPLFFHPAVRAMRRHIQETRELACDDLAAELLHGRNAYAGSLVQLARSITTKQAAIGRALGVFEGDVLEKRIMNLIEPKVKQARWRLALSTVSAIVLLAGCCLATAHFGLRPVFAATVTKIRPIATAVTSASTKAASVMASVNTNTTPDPAPLAATPAPSADTPNPGPLSFNIAQLDPEPSNAAAQDSVTYSGTAPKYPNPGDLKPVSFQLGHVSFEPGDSITIDELRGTSDKVIEGNLYQIKGHYTLTSHDDALLAASVTTSSRDKQRTGISPSLNMSVNKGDGKFTLWLFMQDHGDPHLSFYPSNGGSSFASVYFKTGDTPPALTPINATPTTPSDVPRGWTLMGNAPEHFHTGIDPQTPHDGTPTAFLASKSDEPFKGFGTLGQYFLGTSYLGKRIRLHGWVRSENVKGWAGLWMRVDTGTGDSQKSAAFDNMQSRAITGNTNWTPYDIVLDVPRDVSGIGMGILLEGPGKVWLSGLKIDIVPTTIPTTDLMKTSPAPIPTSPVNLDFGH